MTLDERAKLKAKRDLIIEFIGSVVHSEYLKGTQAQIDLEQDQMLDDPTTTHEQWIELRAQRRLLKSSLTFFEDMISTLDKQIGEELPEIETINEIQLDSND